MKTLGWISLNTASPRTRWLDEMPEQEGAAMKYIIAIIQPDKLDDVIEA